MGDSDYGDIWRSALDANIPNLQRNLLLTDAFYGYLIQRKVFSQDTIEEFKGEASGDAQILKLVGYLKRRNDQCFRSFLSILESTDNRYLREVIEQSMRNARLLRQRQDAELSELLRMKERHILELEERVKDLAKRCVDAEDDSKMEMDRSKYYLEVIENLTSVRSMTTHNTTLEERESDLEEMAGEMESLRDHVQTLETSIRKANQDLEKTKRQLDTVIESEKQFKRNLGLQEDADAVEVIATIQEMKRSQAELKTIQKKLDSIIESKDTYVEEIRKLKQKVNWMEADRRRKDLALQRFRRNKDDSLVLRNARTILNEKKPNANGSTDQRLFEKLTLPVVEIGSRFPSARDRNFTEKFSTAREQTNRSQLQVPQPNSVARATSCLSSNEPRYCVLCRKEYHVGEACRIHPAAKRNGRYLCCKVVENGVQVVGCRTMTSHLCVQVIGGEGNEICLFHDQHGKLTRFQGNEEEKESPATFLSRR